MKKIISILTAAAIALSATACAGSASASNTKEPEGTNKPSSGQEEQLPESQANDNENVPDVEQMGEITGEITVSAYETVSYKSFLDEAAAAFESKYPGTKVNVSTFSAMPEIKTSESGNMKMQMIRMEKDEQAEQDYINKINTELMSGGGADVLAMDILPYHKYAEIGQLEDMSSYMASDPEFNPADYAENILNAMRYKGGQYVFPLDYSFDYLAYDSSLFTEEQQAVLQQNDTFTYEQLIEMGLEPFAAANSNSEEPIYMFGANPQNMFKKIFDANYSKFVDVETKTVNFSSGDFVALLNAVKDYEVQGYIKPGNVDEKGMMTADAFQQMNAEQYLYKAKAGMTLLQQFNKNPNRRMMFAGSTSVGNEENDVISGVMTSDKDERAFSSSRAFGINANSSNKATAWAFIQFMAGEELQASMNMMGLPVNKLALAEKTKQDIIGQLAGPGSEEVSNTVDVELDQEQTEIYSAYMAELDRLTGMLNTYYIKDQTVENAIAAEIGYFFDGSKSAEETANVLQSKIDLYLNE